jgi:hypothetical protein
LFRVGQRIALAQQADQAVHDHQSFASP